MGVNLYQNNFSSDGLYSAFVGVNGDGNLLPPTGSEVIETYITASSAITKLDDVNKETYKRIFHNLPYLLKKKGTIAGLRALINTYGIPDTILRTSEFGGKDKDNSNDYAYYNNGTGTTRIIKIPWELNSNWGPVNNVYSSERVPNTLQFRFKVEDTSSPYPASSTLVFIPQNAADGTTISLEYDGPGLASGSYSGSIPSSSYQYANLVFRADSTNTTYSASISLPFYNGDWWSVMVTSGSSEGFEITAANKIYNGDDGFTIGFIESSSFSYQFQGSHGWGSSDICYISSPAQIQGGVSPSLSGSYQEVRFYNTIINSSSFRDYTMNPYSIEGNGINSAPNQLAFRATLGSELIVTESNGIGYDAKAPHYQFSTHPKVTGSWVVTESFATDDSRFETGTNTNTEGIYRKNREFIYYDQTPVGIKNRISEKIRTADNNLPTGDVLTPYISIQQNWVESSSYTEDINYAEIAFSPQNEINDDINSSLGYFNIGEYIGDPSIISQSVDSYPLLDNLRDSYFEKYIAPYNWNDYTRLIKYFDNSLFKMVEDFTPVRSSLASGVVIKQNILERNRQKPPDVETSLHDYTGSIESGFISGGAGGSFNSLNVLGSSPEGQSQGFINSIAPYVTQSWSTIIDSPVGLLAVTQSSQDEFYDGELSGSAFTVTNGDLNVSQQSYSGTNSFVANYPTTFAYNNYNTFISKLLAGAPTNGQFAYWKEGTDYNQPSQTYILAFAPNDSNGINRSDYLTNYNTSLGSPTLQINTVSNVANPSGTYIATFNGAYTSTLNGWIALTLTTNETLNNIEYLDNDWIQIFATYNGALPNSFPSGQYVYNVLVNDAFSTLSEEISGGNPLLNNVLDNRLSTIYQDVDYAGGIIPVNQNLLATNSALKFPIPDSNYTQTAWKNGRYNGTRLSSPNFNIKS